MTLSLLPRSASNERGLAGRAAALLAGQSRVLGLLATGSGLHEVLDALLLTLEEQLPAARCAILLADPDGRTLRHANGPSLPAAYAEGVAALPVGPRMGSCGAAAFLRERVVVPDVRTSPAFDVFRELAESLRIRASWSQPIFASGGGDVLGTIAVYEETPRAPTDEEVRIIEDAASIAGLAIERTRSEAALRASEDKFRRLVEHASDVILSVEASGRLSYCSANVQAVLGWSPPELEGARATAFIHPGDLPRLLPKVRRAWEGMERPTAIEFRTRHRDGTWHWVTATVSPMRDPDGVVRSVVGVLRDISERKAMEAQLMLADRLATVGTLSAGVAHEINNPLCFVLTNLGFVAERITRARALGGGLSPAELREVSDALAEAIDGAHRVEAIVADLKTLSRAEPEGPSSADLADVIGAAARMLGKQLRHRARLVLDVPRLPRVVGDDARLGQVFLNLLTNALQALPAAPPERNEVRVAARLDRDRVVATVSDNGVGMEPAVVQRIFEPFFTTKPLGVGTGLGLPIVHGILESLGGAIEVSSQPGIGTTFRVSLPVATVQGGGQPTRDVAPTIMRRRLLLVDDEGPIGRSLRRSLAQHHDVDFVTSGFDALERLAAGERYDVVLCDLMMPGMTGIELHRHLERDHPELAQRTGFLTGGAFTPDAHRFLEEMGWRVLQKPFSADALRKLVVRLLEV